jgi:hypothetical protein
VCRAYTLCSPKFLCARVCCQVEGVAEWIPALVSPRYDYPIFAFARQGNDVSLVSSD